MRKSLVYTVVFLQVFTFSIQAQDLYIKVPINNQGDFEAIFEDEKYTGESFEVTLNIPNITNECSDILITYNFPSQIKFVDLSDSEFYVVSQVGQTLTIGNLSASPITGASNVQVIFSVLGNGSVCQNTPLTINAEIAYVGDNNSICTSIISNDLKITPIYDDDVRSVNLQFQTIEQDRCLGGYKRMRFKLNEIDNYGGYNLSNIYGSISLEGEIISVIPITNNPTFQVSANSCESTIDFTLSSWSIRSTIQFDVVVKTSCDCISENTLPHTSEVQVSIEGQNPCGDIISINTSKFYEIVNICCEGGNIYPLFFTGFSHGGTWCDNQCIEYDFHNLYQNSNSPFEIKNYTVTQTIPSELNVTAIFSGFGLSTPSVKPIEVCYTLDSDPTNWICQLIDETGIPNRRIYFTNNPSLYPHMSFYKADNDRVHQIKWSYKHDIVPWNDDQEINRFFFRILPNVTSVSPVITETTFDKYINNAFVESVSLPKTNRFFPFNCNQIYQLSSFINPQSYPNDSDNTVSAIPTEELELSIRITNKGTSDDSGILKIKLPDELIYLGDLKYAEIEYTNINPVLVNLPSTENISYNSLNHELTWLDLSIDPACDDIFYSEILTFNVKVKPGTYASTYKTIVTLDGMNVDPHFIQVREQKLVKGYVARSCPDGSEMQNDIEVSSGEQIQLTYNIINEGNVKIRDILVSSLIPSINDYSFDEDNTTILSRDSELDFSFAPTQPTPQNYIIGFHDLISDLSNFQGQNTDYNKKYFQAYLSGELSPGDSKQVKLNIDIPATAQIGQLAFNDFYFYGYDGSVVNIDLSESGLSEMTNFLIAEVNNCPVNNECADIDQLDNRVEDAFNIYVTNNEVEVTTQNLQNNDSWYPIWNDGTVGGTGYQTGNGSYAHSYTTPGEYEICISIENYKDDIAVAENELCHCKILCQTISIE